jgi:hypothetical protein
MTRGELLIGAIAGAFATFGISLALDRRRRRPRGGTYYAGMIRAKPGMVDQYMQLHDSTWPEVMDRMYKANMRDFVVWLHEETNTVRARTGSTQWPRCPVRLKCVRARASNAADVSPVLLRGRRL